jgi:ribosomal protein L37E
VVEKGSKCGWLSSVRIRQFKKKKKKRTTVG